MSGVGNNFRVLIDTNILISAVLSRNSVANQFVEDLIEDRHLIICSYTITEASRAIADRFPDKPSLWDKYLSRLEFELAYTPSDTSTFEAPPIRDEKDRPILVSAILAQPIFWSRGIWTFIQRISGSILLSTPPLISSVTLHNTGAVLYYLLLHQSNIQEKMTFIGRPPHVIKYLYIDYPRF